MVIEREILTWSDFGEAAGALTRAIREDGYRPDVVVSVARGGLGLGMALGYGLDVKEHRMLNVEFYTGVDQRLPEPRLLAPLPDAGALRGRRVLVADDVADTGHTLRHVVEHCLAVGGAEEVRVAVVYDKPQSVLRPDYRWRTTSAWIEFPWSAGVDAGVGAALAG